MSDLSQGAANFLNPAVLFASDTRLYAIDTPLGPDALLVERFTGREELSALYEYQVDCVSTDAHLELKRLLGKQAALRTRLANGALATRSGFVSAVAQLGSDGGLARYRLTLVPWLALATYQRRSRVYQDASVLDIVADVLAAYRPHNDWRATPDAEAFLAKLRARSYCCQYRESDYAFLCRILTEEGIGFYFEEAEDGSDAARQRLVLFADSTCFADDASAAANGGIRFHRNAAVETQEAIQALGAERQLQSATTTIATWDYKAKRVTAATLPGAHHYGNAPAITGFFERFVHDSRAWFKPFGKDVADLQHELERLVLLEEKEREWEQTRAPYEAGFNPYRLTRQQRERLKKYKDSKEQNPNATDHRDAIDPESEGREPMLLGGGYLRYRKIYMGSDGYKPAGAKYAGLAPTDRGEQTRLAARAREEQTLTV